MCDDGLGWTAVRRVAPFVLIAFVALVAGAYAGYRGDRFHAPRSEGELERAIAGVVPGSLERHRVPGAAVALVHDRRVVWSRGFGVRDVRSRAPVTADTRFQVASLSKAVSAFGLLRLAAAQHLDLDAPLPVDGWSPPESAFDPRGITLRRILSHTAGLSVPGYVGVGAPGSLIDSLRGKTGDAGPVRLVHEPGTTVAYSGGGYTVAELWATEAAGESFEDLMRDTVLRPLGMRASSYDQVDTDADATGHDARERPLPAYRFSEHAAASLRSTAPDMGRFVAALPRSMMEPAPATDGKWGMGLELRTLRDGTRMVFHIGNNRGWQSRIAAFPDRGWGLVVLTNSDNGGDVYADVLHELIS
jgi:CubicO group peptidase (beta-lactamase class C family)